ncbi:unnamed protein product [Peniophora sp. CBMAI 1063]|nr:unnamed protein product [Peniophora sp. CBMAI 1063]
MSRPRPGVHSAGLKIDPDRVSPLSTERTLSQAAPRVKRQRVEVVLDINARTPTPSLHGIPVRATRSVRQSATTASSSTGRSIASSSSRSIKREIISLEDDEVDELAESMSDLGTTVRAAFNMAKWKDDLRALYSADCPLSEKDVGARLKILFAELPDEPTKKIASEYAGDHARKRRKTIESELKSTQAQLAKLQSKAAVFDEKFYQAEHESDVKNSKLTRVKSVSALVDGFVGGSAGPSTRNAGGRLRRSEPHLDTRADEPPQNFDAPIIVNGYLQEVQRKYNAICVKGVGVRPTVKKDWKIWSLTPKPREGEDAAAFCSTTDVMEAPPHLTCTKCKEGPRLLRGFPTDPTKARVVQPRCLYTMKLQGITEASRVYDDSYSTKILRRGVHFRLGVH